MNNKKDRSMKRKTLQSIAATIPSKSGIIVGEALIITCIEELLRSSIRLYNCAIANEIKISENTICTDHLARAYKCGEIIAKYQNEIIEYSNYTYSNNHITKSIMKMLQDEMSFTSISD